MENYLGEWGESMGVVESEKDDESEFEERGNAYEDKQDSFHFVCV
jgi:hypothetical protein